jgi:ring-1,2-phenylacetyl-CoA epoxidase subunit PaaE
MARFHPLEVTDVRRETRDAVVVTLKPRDGDGALFDFIQGQYLTFRREFDGVELRRSYSICAGKDEGVLRVGIKRVDGGAFSTWANENLKPGEVLEAMPPMGSFHAPIEPEAAKNYLGFAGGSGITPLLSIVKTVLAREPKSRFTLVYANRQISSIMFREELEDVKNTYLGRLSILHVLESEAQEIDLFTGRIDSQKCSELFRTWIDLPSVDTAFICGPEPMMLAIAASLREHGLEDRQIKFELFASGQPGQAKVRPPSTDAADAGAACDATVTLDGATRSFRMPKQGQSLLEAALASSIDAPYACKAGVCSTCRAKVLEG